MNERKEQSHAYYLANMERIKAYNREYYRRNRERQLALTLEWQKKHPLQVSDIHARSYQKHREKRLAYQKAYNARKRGVVANDS